jgi:predicted metal-dependent phosphoesterase TrpH
MPDETVYADLHTHTHCSDGTLAPEALVARAAERGLKVLAVTDHDTTRGLEAARAAAEAHGLTLVAGAELSVEVEGRAIHLLGYGFDDAHPAIREYLASFTERRRARLDEMRRALVEQGVSVSTEVIDRQVGTSAAPGRPHLARALVEEGHVETYRAAFEQHLETDRPAYVPAPTSPAETAIEVLHAAGGVAVVAHPGQWMPGDLLTTLREKGVDGIECITPSHPDYLVDYYQNLCRSHNLLMTGGSDYHGEAEGDTTTFGRVGLTQAAWERFRAAAL